MFDYPRVSTCKSILWNCHRTLTVKYTEPWPSGLTKGQAPQIQRKLRFHQASIKALPESQDAQVASGQVPLLKTLSTPTATREYSILWHALGEEIELFFNAPASPSPKDPESLLLMTVAVAHDMDLTLATPVHSTRHHKTMARLKVCQKNINGFVITFRRAAFYWGIPRYI